MPKQVIFPLHGIRSTGAWYGELSDGLGDDFLLRQSKWSYGKFSAIEFLFPCLRRGKVKWFSKTYHDEISRADVGKELNTPINGQANLPSVIAHSFGTYILGYALLHDDTIKLDKALLCGSILPENFPWNDIIERGQVREVKNEQAQKDLPVSVVQYFVRGAGPSGINGFIADLVQKEIYPSYAHSDFFTESHIRDKWVPYLKKNTKAKTEYKKKTIDLPKEQAPWGTYLAMFVLLILLGVLFLPFSNSGKVVLSVELPSFNESHKRDIEDGVETLASLAEWHSDDLPGIVVARNMLPNWRKLSPERDFFMYKGADVFLTCEEIRDHLEKDEDGSLLTYLRDGDIVVNAKKHSDYRSQNIYIRSIEVEVAEFLELPTWVLELSSSGDLPGDLYPIDKYSFIVDVKSDLFKQNTNQKFSQKYKASVYFDNGKNLHSFDRPLVLSNDNLFQVAIKINADLPGLYLVKSITINYFIQVGEDISLTVLDRPVIFAFDGKNPSTKTDE